VSDNGFTCKLYIFDKISQINYHGKSIGKLSIRYITGCYRIYMVSVDTKTEIDLELTNIYPKTGEIHKIEIITFITVHIKIPLADHYNSSSTITIKVKLIFKEL
jgi:hypothetical protein